jgi:predicted RNase H-like HicB family nuclease
MMFHKMPAEELSMQIDYTIHIWKEGSHYIAHAMPINVMSAGPSPGDARKALTEAVALFIETARDMGTLDEVLEECGYRFEGNEWVSPAWISVERASAGIGASPAAS